MQQDFGAVLGYNIILNEYNKRNIIIFPFDQNNLKNASYDVTLGRSFYEERSYEPERSAKDDPNVFNPFSEKDVEKCWGSLKFPEKCKDLKSRLGLDLEGIEDDREIILLSPGSTILAHTNEWIGGRKYITTMMKTRSSYGRSFIQVCKCAGWGDVGFYNRWTMEITNTSKYHSVPLVVGNPLAQIVFLRVEGFGMDGLQSPEKKYTSAHHGNKYQSVDILPEFFDSYDQIVIGKLEQIWKPEMMLPRLYMEGEKKDKIKPD